MLPEAQLILKGARGDDDAFGSESPVDARRVVALAGKHQVAGLLYHEAACRSEAPLSGALENARRSLEATFWHDVARNEVLRRDLGRLQRHLDDRAIDAIVFKGPFLAFEAYPHSGARPIGDVDLCISEDDYDAAVDMLRELGYGTASPLPESGAEALSRAHHSEQLRFTAPGRRPVELHFRLVSVGPPRPEPWLWSTARSLDLGGATIRIPGPEAMLFHLLLHAAQHGFAVLRLLHDIRFALEVDGAQVDVDALAAMARPYRCDAALYHALTLAEEMAGATFPSELVATFEPGRWRRAWFRRAWSLDRVRRLDAPLRSDTFEAPRLYLLEMDTLRRRFAYLRSVLRHNGGVRRSVSRALAARRAESSAPAAPPPSRPSSEGAGNGAARRLPRHPHLRDDVLVFSVSDHTLLHDAFLERTATLRPEVRELAELCTGDRTLGEIVGAVARARSSPEDVVVAGVVGAVMELERSGFLVAERRP